MAKKPSPDMALQGQVIESALNLASEHGWRHVSLAEIADKANLSNSQLRSLLPTKGALIGLMVRHTDTQLLQNLEPFDGDEGARERLFDILMARFDILTPHRTGIAAVLRDGPSDPLSLVRQICCFHASMKAMLDAAQIPTSGPFGALRIKGGMAVYAATFRVWLGDDSPDMAKTMAALDKTLLSIDRFACHLPG